MQKKSAWPRVRKFFNDIHLWLGLSSGLVVVAVCLSGTIYVWNTELTEWSAPHLYEVKAENRPVISVDSLKQMVADSAQGPVTAIMVPSSNERTYQFTVKKDGDKRGVTYFVNPYSGAITGTSKETTRTKSFMATMFSLHRWLCLDKIGKKELGSAITGIATIIFTLGCITGLIIWFPQKLRNWKQGLKVKFRGNWKRTNHDLHNTLAFYSVFFLIIMGITGPFFSFTWYRTGLQKTLGTYKAPPAETKNQKGDKAEKKETVALLSLNEYIAVANKELNYAGDYTITLPAGNNTLSVAKNKRGFFAPAAADRLTLDAATASVKKKEIFSQKPFNERVGGSIKALHTGSVYGAFTKIIYFLACLIATSLPITGTMIWLNKLKKKRRRAASTLRVVEEAVVA